MGIIFAISQFLRREKCNLSNIKYVISDVYIALLPFIMDLVHYDSIIEFFQNISIDKKFHGRSLIEWHTNRLKQ